MNGPAEPSGPEAGGRCPDGILFGSFRITVGGFARALSRSENNGAEVDPTELVTAAPGIRVRSHVQAPLARRVPAVAEPAGTADIAARIGAVPGRAAVGRGRVVPRPCTGPWTRSTPRSR